MLKGIIPNIQKDFHGNFSKYVIKRIFFPKRPVHLPAYNCESLKFVEEKLGVFLSYIPQSVATVHVILF